MPILHLINTARAVGEAWDMAWAEARPAVLASPTLSVFPASMCSLHGPPKLPQVPKKATKRPRSGPSVSCSQVAAAQGVCGLQLGGSKEKQ